MTFLHSLKSMFGSSGKYVSEKMYHASLASREKTTPQLLKQLRGHGVSDSEEKKLEFFFYTDTSEKGRQLSDELKKLEYESTYRQAAKGKLICITGWTAPIQMSDAVVMAWDKQMVDLGYKFDCDFDGWGTKV